jgi:hypothetical protein
MTTQGAVMKKFLILVFLFLATSAGAQSLPDAQCATLKQLGAKFGTLNKGTDDQRRQFALIVAEQFAFSFPGEGWGSKSAGGGRPQTKDVVARQRNGVLDGWDLVNGSTLDVVCTSHVDLQGQQFIAVNAVDHLESAPPPPPPPPGDFVTRQQFETALSALEARIAKLEQTPPASGGDPSDAAKQQLDVSKQILELLKKTAAKFGVQ